MFYSLIRNVIATPCKYYMTSNITTTEDAYKFLSFVIISQVYLQSQGQCFPKYFPKIFTKMFPKNIPSFLRFS